MIHNMHGLAVTQSIVFEKQVLKNSNQSHEVQIKGMESQPKEQPKFFRTSKYKLEILRATKKRLCLTILSSAPLAEKNTVSVWKIGHVNKLIGNARRHEQTLELFWKINKFFRTGKKNHPFARYAQLSSVLVT